MSGSTLVTWRGVAGWVAWSTPGASTRPPSWWRRNCRRPTRSWSPKGPPAACGAVRKDGAAMISAAIYARVSSARQKEQETIVSQTEALRAHAAQLGLDVPQEWVFEDDGHSGA